MGAAEFEVLPAALEEVLASGLFSQLDEDLLTRYPGERINGIDPQRFLLAAGHFVMARHKGEPVACGSFVPLDAHTAEIKRMFTAPAARGNGIARAILMALETEARARGILRIVIETGNGQPEALALYKKCGYHRAGPFGNYIANKRSVFLQKVL